MLQEGGCQCGALRISVAPGPSSLYVCHCTECHKQSASAFGISLAVARETLSVTKGEPKSWTRLTDSGRRLRCLFCPTCGSRVWHEPAENPQSARIKGGALDSPPDLSDAIYIWTKSKLAGLEIPAGAKQFPGEPD